MATARARRTASTDVGHRLGHDAQPLGRRGHLGRGDGPGRSAACRRRRTRPRSAPSASSISAGSRPWSRPTTMTTEPASVNSSARVGGRGRGTVEVVGAVDAPPSGRGATTSNRPGSVSSAERLGDHLLVERAVRRTPRPRPARPRRCRPGGRRGPGGTGPRPGPRRAEVDQPPADGDPVGVARRSRRRAPRSRPAPSAVKTPAGRGRSRPARGGCSGLMMPAFSVGDRAPASPAAPSVWSRPTLVHDRDLRRRRRWWRRSGRAARPRPRPRRPRGRRTTGTRPR